MIPAHAEAGRNTKSAAAKTTDLARGKQKISETSFFGDF